MDTVGRVSYIPALRFRWLTPLYDRIMPVLMPERQIRRALVTEAGIRAGQRVLDLGCGTGTLALMIKQAEPEAVVTGLDVDEEVLVRATAKAAAAGVGGISWDRGLAYRLPYADGSFDRVVSSLMFHHLTREQKRQALAEALRVLAPGGRIYVADLGPPHSVPTWLVSLVMRQLEHANDNIAGRLPGMLAAAGFANVRVRDLGTASFGRLVLYSGNRPIAEA
ncbi:MAG: class I SAM-dependent methyltransferase [Anaerolineae bacterium]